MTSNGTPTDEQSADGPSAPSQQFLELIPMDFARQHLILSAGRDESADEPVEQLSISVSTDPIAVLNVRTRLGVPTVEHVVDGEQLARAIDEAYGSFKSDPTDVLDAAEDGTLEQMLDDADRDLLSTEGKSPVVRLVDAILFEALGSGASDVHIQPLADRAIVRYRIDGVLHAARDLRPGIAQSVVSRIKVMGQMDIAERRMPQDGRASVRIGQGGSHRGFEETETQASGRVVDLRISTLPTNHGERTVIRLLEPASGDYLRDLGSLGMPPDTKRRFAAVTSKPYGIVLVTGPTGSGKTTTLYACLRRVVSGGDGPAGRLNVMTIEDPIEYELSSVGLAVSQSQVNTTKGVTFAAGLRHLLRQDPDIIMVGEIRDAETARIAIQASLTGHLVLSTLHTNDAASATTRLIDLGVESYLVGASLEAVLAQRLLRRTHHPCDGSGCPECFHTGYRGRIGVYELLEATDTVRELITRAATTREIRRAATDAGMRTLADEAERLVQKGITTPVEAGRVVQLGSDTDVALASETASARSARDE